MLLWLEFFFPGFSSRAGNRANEKKTGSGGKGWRNSLRLSPFALLFEIIKRNVTPNNSAKKMKRFCQLMSDSWSEFESCVIVSGLTAVHKDELTAWAGAEDCDITFEAGTRKDETFVVVHQEDTVKLLHTLEEQGYGFLRSEEEHGDESP